ncbi:hypothetical protein D3C76_595630 [compost metagenome]
MECGRLKRANSWCRLLRIALVRLGPADLVETLQPVPGRRRRAALLAECQGTNYAVQQVAFVGVIAVDAQAGPAHGVEHRVCRALGLLGAGLPADPAALQVLIAVFAIERVALGQRIADIAEGGIRPLG